MDRKSKQSYHCSLNSKLAKSVKFQKRKLRTHTHAINVRVMLYVLSPLGIPFNPLSRIESHSMPIIGNQRSTTEEVDSEYAN